MSDSVEEELRIMEERAAEDPHEHIEKPLDQLCTRPAVCVDVTTTLEQTLALMRQNSLGAVVVTDGGALAGIFTERDLLTRVVGKIADLRGPVSEVMTRDPEVLQLGDKIIFVMNMMHVGGYRHVPVVDEDHRPLHVISIKDVMAFVLEPIHDKIVSIPPEPFRGRSGQHGG